MLNRFFETCPEEIRSGIVCRHFLPRECILSPGFTGSDVYILKAGQAKLVVQKEEGNALVLGLYNSWDLLGELEAFTGRICEKHIIALQPCEVYVISKGEFFKWLHADFDFNCYILNLLSQKLLRLSAISQVGLSGFLRGRVAHILLSNLKSDNIFPYNKQVLSECIGTSVRSLNRILEKLITDDVISVSASRIKVKNVGQLEQLLNERKQ